MLSKASSILFAVWLVTPLLPAPRYATIFIIQTSNGDRDEFLYFHLIRGTSQERSY